jgi:uncharacterized SAM-binding protein YcdF (DUF218 family)
MPPIRPRRGGVFRRVLLVSTLAVIAGLGWGIASLGHLLHHEDPLERADVIFVLGGTHLERAAEAGELFLEGWAPRILLSRPRSDGGEVALRTRGLAIPGVTDVQRQALVQMGVPEAAIAVLDVEQDTTASESQDLRGQVIANGWTRVIAVTSKLHTARASLVMRRHVQGTGTHLIMRASRYDTADIDRWWKTRSDLRFALFEAQKFLAYWVGVAD